VRDSADIPVHRLQHTDFYASATDGGNLGDFAPSHRLDFYAIVWFRSDGDMHYIDFNPYPVKKDLIYLLSRNQVHALPGIPPEANIILFTRSFFDNIEEDALRLLFLPFNNEGIVIEDTHPLQLLFELILSEKERKLLLLYTTAFLTHLQRYSQSVTYKDERLRKVFQLVSQHYKVHKLVDFYAKEIGLTPKRLNQIANEGLGMSVSQLIYAYTLIEAKREICHSTKSMKEIAIDLGFSGQSYFTRFFRKHTGLTPEHFRKVPQ
jgi:AraC family transcriptional activator of pobA